MLIRFLIPKVAGVYKIRYLCFADENLIEIIYMLHNLAVFFHTKLCLLCEILKFIFMIPFSITLVQCVDLNVLCVYIVILVLLTRMGPSSIYVNKNIINLWIRKKILHVIVLKDAENIVFIKVKVSKL